MHAFNRLIGSLRAVLAHRRIDLGLAVLAVALMLPALWHGLALDDVVHRSHLLGPSRVGRPLRESGVLPESFGELSSALANLYAFLPAEKIKPVVNTGYLPWWTYEGTHAAFWRPLTSLTLWLDYQLYPDSWPLMHAHSILWFAAAVFLVAALYRRLMGPVWVAGLAALLYVLDENYYLPAAMIAHRNSLVALVFGLLALLAHHRWRNGGWRLGAVLTPLCLTLSLLSAEAGIATVAYLAAYALVLDRGRWIARAGSLAPSFAVVAAWRIIYVALGYGVCAGKLYLDPAREPLRFAATVVERGPILLLGQLGAPPAFLYNFFSGSARMAHWLLAVGFLVLLFVVLLPLLRRDRVGRFYLVGMLFSVVPICATLPWDRNLLFVGVGGMGLTALFIGALIDGRARLPIRRLYRAGAWTLCVFFLLVHVGGACVGRIVARAFYSGFVDQGAALLALHSPGDLEGATRDSRQ